MSVMVFTSDEFPTESSQQYFALIDGATTTALRQKLYDYKIEHVCLWSGELSPDMQEVAPYLAKIEADTHFNNWLLSDVRPVNGLMYLESSASLKTLRKHLRQFLLVQSPDGNNLIFRFYDPRVFTAFVKIWKPDQQAIFFEHIKQFIVPGYTEFTAYALTGKGEN